MKDGENGIYWLTKTKERRWDLGFARFIKDEDERVDDDIKCRWYNYFRKLFNKARLSEDGNKFVNPSLILEYKL